MVPENTQKLPRERAIKQYYSAAALMNQDNCWHAKICIKVQQLQFTCWWQPAAVYLDLRPTNRMEIMRSIQNRAGSPGELVRTLFLEKNLQPFCQSSTIPYYILNFIFRPTDSTTSSKKSLFIASRDHHRKP